MDVSSESTNPLPPNNTSSDAYLECLDYVKTQLFLPDLAFMHTIQSYPYNSYNFGGNQRPRSLFRKSNHSDHAPAF